MNSAGRGLKPAVTHRTIHLTLPTYSRYLAFPTKDKATLILGILHHVSTTHGAELHEACAMPDHVHLILSFMRGRDLNTDIIKKIKGASARYYLKKMNDLDGHLWARGKNHQEITSKKQFMNTLQYIRSNPLRANISPVGRILSVVIADFNPHVAGFIPQRKKILAKKEEILAKNAAEFIPQRKESEIDLPHHGEPDFALQSSQ